MYVGCPILAVLLAHSHLACNMRATLFFAVLILETLSLPKYILKTDWQMVAFPTLILRRAKRVAMEGELMTLETAQKFARGVTNGIFGYERRYPLHTPPNPLPVPRLEFF